MSVALDEWPLREPFVIAGSTTESIVTVTVTLEHGGSRGRGEALGVDYLGETPESIREQLEACRTEIEKLDPSKDWLAGAAGSGNSAVALVGRAFAGLSQPLPAGGARNALDCALWDLRCKQTGRTIWSVLEIEQPRPVTTAFTLSLDKPAAMADAAGRAAVYPLLKLKLDADDPAARIATVRAARPDAELLVDANGSWSLALLAELAPALVDHRVALVEQPLPRGADAALADWDAPVPLCADESSQTSAGLDELASRYRFVNVKLDKCGGLSEALRIVQRCGELRLGLMVGNMLGSSLAMAPAFVIAQHCRFVDLDGPLLQSTDREPPMRYEGAALYPPPRDLWG
jgi:L-alanine-DL-glutamate epimerase-like enolase superfamily enzyme